MQQPLDKALEDLINRKKGGITEAEAQIVRDLVLGGRAEIDRNSADEETGDPRYRELLSLANALRNYSFHTILLPNANDNTPQSPAE